jgi:APA family basic amino acid/polyamine antiporter
MSLKKIGFWSVFSIVVGSQIGSGVLMLPANMAPYGIYSILGWVIAGVGALALALVFSELCMRFPKTGGPHVYVNEMFGPTASFFTGWTYWIISWVSSTAVVITSIGYLSPFIGNHPPIVYLILEILLLLIITGVNLRGIQAAGEAEFILTVLKIVPLFILPIAAFWYFNSQNFTLNIEKAALPLSTKLAEVTLLALWGFIGVESATTPAGSVHNPSKTIPRAIITGTLCVAFLYLINSIGVMGTIPGATLEASKAPYIDVTHLMVGGDWHLLVSVVSSIVCIGTLNAWMLTSGQIALGLAEDGFMPKRFARTNKYEAPGFALMTSCLGIIPLLIFTLSDSIATQITLIIDISCIAFLFVYLMCVIAYIKSLIEMHATVIHWIYGFTALAFCLWIIYETDIMKTATSALFVISGIPVYFFWWKRRNREEMSVAQSQ